MRCTKLLFFYFIFCFHNPLVSTLYLFCESTKESDIYQYGGFNVITIRNIARDSMSAMVLNNYYFNIIVCLLRDGRFKRNIVLIALSTFGPGILFWPAKLFSIITQYVRYRNVKIFNINVYLPVVIQLTRVHDLIKNL